MPQDIRLIKLSKSLRRIAGESIEKAVMKGGADINAKTSQGRKAQWVKEAMERLDSLVDEAKRKEIMGNCCCATEGRIKKARAIYLNSKNLDDFLDQLAFTRFVGTRFIREYSIIYVFYDRCYCGLVKAARQKISSTYCQCSRAYTQKIFEGIFEKPLQVELIQSVISGSNECKFAVYLPRSLSKT